MSVLVWLIARLNGIADAMGRLILPLFADWPGWLSATVTAGVGGVVMLYVFKHVSNQRGIKQARNDVNAHLLALKLFKDDMGTVFRAQGKIFGGALRLMVLSIVPVLVMAIPMTLLLGQLSLLYQARALHPGEEVFVAVELAGDPKSSLPEVELLPSDAVESMGFSRIRSKREACWRLKALDKPGIHRLQFRVGDLVVEKEIAIGSGFPRVSMKRPYSAAWSDLIFHPGEKPFEAASPVRSIEIDYPSRDSWTSGADNWLIFWFLASTAFALIAKPVLKVNL